MDKVRPAVVYSWRCWFSVITLLICLGVCIPPVSAESPGRKGESPANTVSGPVLAQPASPSVNPVTQAAVKLGILSSLKRINQVSTYLTANAKSGVLISPAKTQPDQHIFSTSFEIIPPDNSTIYASASFFPNNDAVYDTVQYVDKTPKQLQKTVFKHLKQKNVLKKNIVQLDGGSVKVFLMPAGKGCVVIKKEVLQ